GVSLEPFQQWSDVGTRREREVLAAECAEWGRVTEAVNLAGDCPWYVELDRDLVLGNPHANPSVCNLGPSEERCVRIVAVVACSPLATGLQPLLTDRHRLGDSGGLSG